MDDLKSQNSTLSPFHLNTGPLLGLNEAHNRIKDLNEECSGNVGESQLNSIMIILDDICSVELCFLIIELCLKSTNLSYDQKKSVFEKMTLISGHNLALGHLIWERYLEFETDALKPKVLSRASKIPFIDGKRFFNDDSVNYVKTPPLVLDFEEKIAQAGDNKDILLELFESYLEKLTKDFKKEPAIIRAQFERATEIFYDQERIWLKYIAYLKKEFNVKAVLFKVLNKALRASFKCKEPFTEVWLETLYFLEENNHAEIEVIVSSKLDTRSIDAGLYSQILQYYFGYIRRAKHFDSEMKKKLLFSKYGRWKKEFSDNTEVLAAYVETLSSISVNCLDLVAANKAWEDHVSGLSKSAHFWVRFAEWKLRTEGVEGAEKVYKRAAASEPVPFDLIAGKWKEFEYRFGSLESFGNALDKIVAWKLKCNPSVAPLKESSTKRARPEANAEGPKKTKMEEAPILVELPPQNKGLTVFVNNLDFSIKESFLRLFFGEHAGKIHSVRLGKNSKGQSRGFATVDFVDEESFKKALGLDRTRLNGRPVFISPYQDVGSSSFKPPVQHATGRNPKTLYVSQLPLDCLEEDLKSLFSSYEGFKAVRLGLKKDGTSKGFAYVDFGTEAQAGKALEMDRKIVGGNVISVLISDPSLAPKRQHQKKSMVPPTVSKQNLVKKTEPSEPQPVEERTVGASNEDFRRMLGL